MSLVREWFHDFYVALTERSGRTDWFPAESGYWQDFERELVRQGTRQEEADLAISRVCNLPNLFMHDFRPLILAEVKKIQREVAIAGPGPAIDPKDAEMASRDCPECSGTGLAVRYVHPDLRGRITTLSGVVAPVGGRFTIPCSCPFGRHLARSGGAKGSVRKTIDECPALRRSHYFWATTPDHLDCKYRHHPADWCEAEGRPYADESAAIKDFASLKAAVHETAEKMAYVPTKPSPTPPAVDSTSTPRKPASEPPRAVPASPAQSTGKAHTPHSAKTPGRIEVEMAGPPLGHDDDLSW